MIKGLSGKTAIITGSSSGIGYATAITLAQAGAAVVIHARRKDRLDKLAAEITALGGRSLVVSGDATVQADIDLLMDRALTWNEGGCKVDTVVICAGRGLTGGILDSEESKWQEVYQLNVLGAAHLLRRAGQYMVEQKKGDLVVIGSVVSRYISPYSSLYGSSKFAIYGIVEGLRREICSYGVRVSLVNPGITISEFQVASGHNEENFGSKIAHFGKLLEPQNIADGIHWLLTLPPHVNVNEILIRPTGQSFP